MPCAAATPKKRRTLSAGNVRAMVSGVNRHLAEIVESNHKTMVQATEEAARQTIRPGRCFWLRPRSCC